MVSGIRPDSAKFPLLLAVIPGNVYTIIFCVTNSTKHKSVLSCITDIQTFSRPNFSAK